MPVMRHGHIDLDLSTHEFLTHQQEQQVAEFNKQSHKERASTADSLLVRDGDPDPTPGAHSGGNSIRIARDRISGIYFARIAEHLPAEANRPHLERRHARITEMKPFHVPGEGYWLPLKEILPDHPHAQSEPIREAHKNPAA